MVKNSINSVFKNQESGLAYTTTLKELVYKDEDGDGVPDWEEGLYGLDPTKKETTPGTPDSVAINKLKAKENDANQANAENIQNEENLTQTDKFSRELFSSTAALNQNGIMDQNTADQLSNSLASKIQNTPIRKIFLLSDIKVINDNSIKAVKSYNDTLNNIQQKYPNKGTVLDVLQKFVIDENNVDSSVLVELDPIIKQTQGTINEMAKMNVPQFLASTHLDILNALERLSENTSDIRLYDSDVIVALSGISQYQNNATLLESAVKKLTDIINNKLNN
ncbi:MAG: hypothetical protein WC793_01930 [Candidatus Paceibacterota bacterium]